MSQVTIQTFLYKAIKLLEVEREANEYDNPDRLHKRLLCELDMRESEYLDIMREHYI